jgi:SAM-dependent methyltransferase
MIMGTNPRLRQSPALTHQPRLALVVAVHVWHHVGDWRTATAEAHRVLRPDGALLLLWFWQYSLTASTLRRRLRPVSIVMSQGMRYRTSRLPLMASLGRLPEQGESCMGIEPIGAEVVETVAGVVRLLRRAAELAWRHADAGGPRSSHQLLALGIDSAADKVSGVLLRTAQFDGPTVVEENPVESVKNYLLGICGSGSLV